MSKVVKEILGLVGQAEAWLAGEPLDTVCLAGVVLFLYGLYLWSPAVALACAGLLMAGTGAYLHRRNGVAEPV